MTERLGTPTRGPQKVYNCIVIPITLLKLGCKQPRVGCKLQPLLGCIVGQGLNYSYWGVNNAPIRVETEEYKIHNSDDYELDQLD